MSTFEHIGHFCESSMTYEPDSYGKFGIYSIEGLSLLGLCTSTFKDHYFLRNAILEKLIGVGGFIKIDAILFRC